MSTRVKVLTVILVVIVLVAAGLVYWVFGVAGGIIKDPGSAFDKTGADQLADDTGSYKFDTDIVNILLLGLDSNAEREQQNKGYRSDVIILCSMNTKTNDVTLLSIPRDTYAHVYTLDSNGNATTDTYRKINAAYALVDGDHDMRAKNAITSVKELLSCSGRLNVPIDYYFTIDMDGIDELCDLLGGVEVTLDVDVPLIDPNHDSLTGGYVGRAGETVTLTGDAANSYLRCRKNIPGEEAGRRAHQRTFMLAAAKKIKSLGIGSVANLFVQMQEFAYTNLSAEQAVAVASIFRNVDMDSVNLDNIPGESEDGGSYFYYANEAGMYNQMREILYNKSE